jgi:signal transduction histidine kinase/HPt (histidine-containing phosphotransfer) domain-containing protein
MPWNGHNLLRKSPKIGFQPVALELDPQKAALRKEAARYRLNVLQFPVMREVGFIVISVFVLVHNYYMYQALSWNQFLLFILIAFSYSLLSWAALYLFYGKTGRLDLGILFLTLDIVIFAAAVYLSGGQESLLFFLFIVRVADQANTSFKRVLWFAHVSPAIYVMLLLYLHYGEGENILLAREIPKVFGIYLCNLYIALTAIAAERLRDRVTAAMRLARKSILNLKAKSRDLEEARMRAEAGNIAKSEFLANINHEIRTPLNGIIGMAQLVMGARLEPQQKEYMEMLQASARSLSSVMNGILDFSKAGSSELVIEPQAFELRSVVTDVMDGLSLEANEKGLGFSMDVAADIPDNLIGDPVRLHQLLEKLAGNAVKFTDAGEISIRVRVEETRVGSVLLGFAISDTGMGIAPDKIGRIFDGFSQADGSSTRRHGGTGLGLALAKRLAERMGGSIRVESPAVNGFIMNDHRPEGRADAPSDRRYPSTSGQPSRGPGSAFYVILPLRLAGEGGTPLADQESPSEQEVLDFSRAVDAVGGDMGLLREILGYFVDDIPVKTDQIREAFRLSDSGRMEETARALKGSAADIGAKGIERCLSQIEIIAREGNLIGTEALLAELEQAIEDFKEAARERNILS